MRAYYARSRADVVRQRRRQQVGKRLSDSAELARRPAAPITARTGVIPIPPMRERPAARRPSEAAWSLPGMEIRMPAVSFSGTGAKWRFVSFGLSLLLAAGLYLAETAPAFQAGPIQLSGNQRIAADEISSVLGIGNAPVFALIPADLERRLRLNFPELLAARVTVGLPNQVKVDLVERTPVVVWNQSGGFTWIDDSGIAFRPRGTTDGIISVQALSAPQPSPMAVVDPLSPQPFIPAELVAAIRALAPHAPAGPGLLYDARYGLGWTDSQGWQVFFGDQPRDMELKLRVYESMVKMVGAKGIQPAFISVQYPNAPFYRMTP